jgi:hypothetical protein
MTERRWVLVGLGCCVLCCVPYACIRFVERQIDKASGRWD